MDRLLGALDRRDIEVFARVDHGGGARAAALELADEELLIFGDPGVGTLLMQQDPGVGYELPMRILVWDDGAETKVAYRPASELANGYALADRTAVLERMDRLLAELVSEALAP
jgi:beta-galactosidase